MTSLLQGLLHITDFGGPVSKTALPVAATCFAIQNAVGIPSVVAQTEYVYDLSGGWTFISATAVSLLARVLRKKASLSVGSENAAISLKDFNWRQLAMSGGVALWALRLSTYLYLRIRKSGEDSRFAKLRTNPRRFVVAWELQAIWVIICLLPVVVVNAIPASVLNESLPAWTKATDVVGLALTVTGFVVECTADYQKSKWLDGKRNKTHDEQFMTHGLFSRSRYPSYFGDVTLFTGMATVAAGLLASEPVQSALGMSGSLLSRVLATTAPFITPSFLAFLFFKVSGIPLSEPKYDKLYGDRKDYQLWKQNTPVFFPRIF